MFRVSKVLDDILVSFAPLPSLFEDQDPIREESLRISRPPLGEDYHQDPSSFGFGMNFAIVSFL